MSIQPDGVGGSGGSDEFDQIIVGAGLAGLTCASELVLRGQTPLLVCETSEVGAVFATKKVGESSTGFMQHLLWQIAWGGGWWYRQARELDIPLRMHPGLGFAVSIEGSGEIKEMPLCATAATVVDVLETAFNVPLDSIRENFRSVLQAAMLLTGDELMELGDVRLSDWLADHGAEQAVSALLLSLAGSPNAWTIEQSTEHMSALGGLGSLRAFLSGEAAMTLIEPNVRDGLCIPLAEEIERRGGSVWRGRRVARVLIEDDVATGVEFEDGTQATAPIVALAGGNPRIKALLDPVPEEVRGPLEHFAQLEARDYSLYALIKGDVVRSDRSAVFVMSQEDGSMMQLTWPIHAVAPWSVEEGHQLLVCSRVVSAQKAEAMGGEEAIHDAIHATNEELYPGYKDALVDWVPQSHKHHWMGPISVAPTLPRTIDSVGGLWFVGDGSAPRRGFWGEAAASCGILGAREMLGVQ